MRSSVKLEATHGPIAGRVFVFEQHDTLIFGRGADCHARLPANDGTVSRHHFLLEVNPPEARLRDLGSTNGTSVNNVRYGGRDPGRRKNQSTTGPEVDLRHGDVIQAGASIFKLEVKGAPPDIRRHCHECGRDVSMEQASIGPGDYVCIECRAQWSGDPQTLVRRLTESGAHRRAIVQRLAGYD